MIFECAAIARLSWEFQGRKRIRNKIPFDKLSKENCRMGRDLSLVQRTQEFVRKFVRLTARKLSNGTDDFGDQSSANCSVVFYVIFPPKQLPNLIYLAAYS